MNNRHQTKLNRDKTLSGENYQGKRGEDGREPVQIRISIMICMLTWNTTDLRAKGFIRR
jgi:hypothetical protein